jgi:hypothetical protein
MRKIFSPADEANSILNTIKRRAKGRVLEEKLLSELWQEVVEERGISGINHAWQWLRLRTSIRRINSQQKQLFDAGNLNQRQMAYRIKERVQESVRESARRVVISAALDEEIGAGGEQFARILSTGAEEPDLAHALLEGKILPLTRVLEELSRFGCQHTYEIMRLKPVGARLLEDRWHVDYG